MQKHTTILLADDHPIFLLGVKSILSSEKSLKIIGEAINGEIALDLARELSPDIAILDMEMPKLNGFQVLEALFHLKSTTKIIFLTMYRDEIIFNKALDLGARGFVLKENASTDILTAIKTVNDGKYFISSLISDYLVNRIKMNSESKSVWEGEKLSPAELKVVQQIGLNKSNKETASDLFLSVRTIENHRNSICKKLGLTGSSALKEWVLQNRQRIQQVT